MYTYIYIYMIVNYKYTYVVNGRESQSSTHHLGTVSAAVENGGSRDSLLCLSHITELIVS